jgi:DUF4097 and DUF4098 domain-containing protein YvlB
LAHEDFVSNGGQRRSPLFAGLLLILLGLIFLADRFYPHLGLGHLIRLYWPVLVILWGMAKLIDHASAQRSGEPQAPLLSGGEAVLLVILALVLATFVFRDWIRGEFPGLEIRVPGFGQSFSRTRSLPPVEIPAGAHVTIDTTRGDIKIVGTDGNELRVGARASATGASETAAGEKLGTVDATIDRTGDGYRVHPASQSDWRSAATVDFDIQMPKTALVAANTSHGDISVDGIAGGVDARTQYGDVRIQNARSDVYAESQRGDVRVTSVVGNLQIHGSGDDVDITSVSGNVTIDGAFLGDTKVRKVNGTLRIKSPRADVTVAQLTGDLALDSGDLSVSGAMGAIKISTRDKDIIIRDAASPLDIAGSHGDIVVHFAKPPQGEVSITNDSGDVELTLPAQSAFQISAVSRSGEVESDFEDPSLRHADETETERMNGTFGPPSSTPAPKISIATSYGTIRVNKSK